MGLDNPLHIAFLVVILLLVFGARRLPEIGRSLGGGMREFKEGITGEAKHSLTQATQQQTSQQQTSQQQPVAQPVAAPPQPVATPPQPAAAPAPPAAGPPPAAVQAPAEPQG